MRSRPGLGGAVEEPASGMEELRDAARCRFAEQLFVLETIAGIDNLTGQPANAGFDHNLISTTLEEGGRLTAELFAPLNAVGDKEGA
jgi:hypothetical protein